VLADGAPRARGRAPRLGQSAPKLLAELGYDNERIRQLVDDGIIGVDERNDKVAAIDPGQRS
jgi:hypothetical protein